MIDIPIEGREFYDKLSEDGRTLLDMDLILPQGYGEVLSGGERNMNTSKSLSEWSTKERVWRISNGICRLQKMKDSYHQQAVVLV